MSNKHRLYLLRVGEKLLPPEVKDSCWPSCRKITNIAVGNNNFQPCIAVGGLPSFDTELVIWAACTNHYPIFLLKESLCQKCPDLAGVSFIHALDTEVERREDGLLCARPDQGQYLVADLSIKDVDRYLDQQYQEYEQSHEEEAELEELESIREAKQDCDAYLDAWEAYQAEDDIEELDGDEWDESYEIEDYETDEFGPEFSGLEETVSTPDSSNGFVGNTELARLKRFSFSRNLHGDPGQLSEARDGLDHIFQQWQFAMAKFTAKELDLIRHLMGHRVFRPRKAKCFQCQRHLYDHLDKTCLRCRKYQITCSDPGCGVCGCKHNPSFARN